MAKLFKIIAVIIMAVSGFIGAVSIVTITDEGALIVLIASLFGVVLGLALYTIGSLLDRVKALEEKLK